SILAPRAKSSRGSWRRLHESAVATPADPRRSDCPQSPWVRRSFGRRRTFAKSQGSWGQLPLPDGRPPNRQSGTGWGYVLLGLAKFAAQGNLAGGLILRPLVQRNPCFNRGLKMTIRACSFLLGLTCVALSAAEPVQPATPAPVEA